MKKSVYYGTDDPFKSPEHIPTDAMAQYYQKRAEGEVGLIVTEGTIVHPTGHGYRDVPNFFGDEALKGWKKILEHVHAAGGKIAPQLWHVGAVHDENYPVDPQHPQVAPSAVKHPGALSMPRALSLDDIAEIVQAFARAAKNAKALGFDAIEIHGAHGYLIDQFFWQRTNQRTDRYGGASIKERNTFALEIVQAIRDAVGPNFPIILRLSQWKTGDYTAKLAETPQALEQWLLPLSQAGVDIFHMSTRQFWQPEFTGSKLNLAAWAKKITGKPAISVGSFSLTTDVIKERTQNEVPELDIENIMAAESNIAAGYYDLIAVGRMLIANPALPALMRQQQFSQIQAFSGSMLASL